MIISYLTRLFKLHRIVNYQLERMWKEAVVVLYQNVYRKTENTTQTLRKTRHQVVIRNQDLYPEYLVGRLW